MSRYKLLPALLETYRKWKVNNKRTSWLYCPICNFDINGSGNSLIKEKDNYWYFKCTNCGGESKQSL